MSKRGPADGKEVGLRMRDTIISVSGNFRKQTFRQREKILKEEEGGFPNCRIWRKRVSNLEFRLQVPL
jgi:hypothetical protein